MLLSRGSLKFRLTKCDVPLCAHKQHRPCNRQIRAEGNKLRSSTAQKCSTSCSLSPVVASRVLACSAIYCLPLFLLMACRPHWQGTKRVTSGSLMFVPVALAYALLLAHSWEPDTLALILPGSLREGFSGGFNPQFFPKLQGIMGLFSRTITATSLLVHLLVINLFAARSLYLQGLQDRVPTRHSIVLCALFGPLGLLSDAVTRLLARISGSKAPDTDAGKYEPA